MFFSTQFLPPPFFPPLQGLQKAARKKHPQWGKTGGTVWRFFAEKKKEKHESKKEQHKCMTLRFTIPPENLTKIHKAWNFHKGLELFIWFLECIRTKAMNLHETISTSPFLWFPFSREWKGFMFNANTTYKVGPERIANGAHLVPTTGYDQSFALAEFWQKSRNRTTRRPRSEVRSSWKRALSWDIRCSHKNWD